MSDVAIQVPCFFLLCALVWKLGSLAINRWGQNEADRTKVLAKAEEDRTKVIAKGFADITSQLTNHGERLGRIEDRLDVRDAIAEAVDDVTSGGVPVSVDDAA